MENRRAVEIIAALAKLWVAPVEGFPRHRCGAEPDWTYFGKAGDRTSNEDGVTIPSASGRAWRGETHALRKHQAEEDH